MAVDMFIKVGDINGEAQDSAHKNDIDVLAWSWGMSNSGSTHVGAGGGTGKVNVQDLSFTKYVDLASATLMQSCASGKHFPTATLVVRKAAGDKPIEYIKITLSEVLIASVSTGGSHGEDRLTENVTLNFGKVKYEYTQQSDTGGSGTTTPMGWDIAGNVAAM